MAQAVDLYGRIDGVVNNAGNLRDGIFHKMPEEDFDAVIAVPLKGCFNMSRAAAPHFKSEASGAFVHMTSTSGLALLTDAANGVTGQVFGVRNNEIFLFSQPRPIRTAHNGAGWTVQGCLDVALPMMKPSFYPLDRSRDVFSWDPV